MNVDLLMRRVIIVFVAPLIPVILVMHFAYMLVLSRSGLRARITEAWQFTKSEFGAIRASWRA